MSQLYAKNELILCQIPKISPKNNFLKKPVTRDWVQPEWAGNWDPGSGNTIKIENFVFLNKSII
jgi:hypothetical protein